MHFGIFSILILIVLIPIGTVFADGSLISVNIDNENYQEGDIILVSGNVSTIIGNTQVTLQLFSEGNLVDVDQIEVGQDGNYYSRIKATGPLWQNSGEYTIKVVYGEANIAEKSFNYLSNSETVETSNIFEVDAGSSGTFDIRYTIRGGIIETIKIQPEIFGLILKIDSSDNGFLVLDLPRQFIDAEKQNGKDEEFIIIIDNVQVSHTESKIFSDMRTITIDFEKGDSEIQIIGTHVIPEFGTIVMIILTVGIMTSIILTRNRFQIKI
jgi:predicted secreted protein with PEFG-CTERM motif